MSNIVYTIDGTAYINPAYGNPIANAVGDIINGSAPTTNLASFLNVSSPQSNQIWGGLNRADINNDLGRVTSADALEWLKRVLDGGEGDIPESYQRTQLVATELYASWKVQGIGYYGDSANSPLFINLNIDKRFDVEVGAITNWAYNNQSYYGFDTGPNLFYGQCRNAYFQGKDDKFYRIHACRWTGNDSNRSVYLRLDASHILSSQSYLSYTSDVFNSLTIGGLTLDSTSVNSFSFIANGYVGLYWGGVSTNPFSSTGSTTICTMNGVTPGPYGGEFRNSNGKITLSIVDRVSRFAAVGATPPVGPNSSYFQSVPGLENNDNWNVFVSVDGGGGFVSFSFDIVRQNGGFTVTNNDTNNTFSYSYLVVRV